MYKVMLVDDERIVKLAVKSMIRWEECGLELAGTASNGINALEMAERSRPDIIITDIKMPGMDGVELIKRLGEKGFDGEILVLSNYNDFELVKEAMRYGAYDYVLKITVKSEDFSKLLGEMTAKLDKRRGAKRNITGMENNTDSIRADLIKRVLSGDREDYTDEVNEMEKLYKMSSQDILHAFVVKAGPSETGRALTRLADVLKSLGGEFFAKSLWYSVVGTDADTAVFGAMYRKADFGFEPENAAERLSELTLTYYNIKTGVVCSGPATDYRQFFDLSRKCMRTSELFFYDMYAGKTISSLMSPSEDEQPLADVFKALSDRIYSDMLKSEISTVTDNFRQFAELASQNRINPGRFKKNVKKLLREVGRRLINNGYCSEEPFDEYKNDEDAIYSATSEEKLLDSLKGMVTDAQATLSSNRVNCRKEVREALEYIERHARERIALGDIAKHVSLNETYLCKVFKDDTGKNIVPYINEVKMKMAYALLSKGDVMIKEAASAVGIDDQFYFNRLFKKYYGVTPRDMKNR